MCTLLSNIMCSISCLCITNEFAVSGINCERTDCERFRGLARWSLLNNTKGSRCYRQEQVLESTSAGLLRCFELAARARPECPRLHSKPCAQVERLAEAVEAVNPNRASLSSPLVNGKWRLLYTTSASILGTSRPPPLRPAGDIFQTIGARC